MINMKKLICVTSVLMLALLGLSVCHADSMIPNLVGTWIVKSEGGVLLKGKESGPKTLHSGPFSTLNAEAVVTRQQGRIFHGDIKSDRAAKNFIGAIGHDNKTLYYADEDGFLEGRLINENTMEIVYRHVNPIDTVVAVGLWTRKK